MRPSLKEPLLSRAVSEDFIAWDGLFFLFVCIHSTQPTGCGLLSVTSWLSASWSSFSISVVQLVFVLRSSLRGLFGRSFLCATVPLSVPSWTPADCLFTSALGCNSPDTDKIYSIVLRYSSPLIIGSHAWPISQVKGTHRAGREPQGFARAKGGESTRHKVERFLHILMLYLQ
jgi:hypothetical protein